jgi:hypothetical protein
MIAATYNCKGVTVHVDDAELRQLTPEQLQARRQDAQRVASRILARAMARGAVDGLSPADWQRRFGGGNNGKH